MWLSLTLRLKSAKCKPREPQLIFDTIPNTNTTINAKIQIHKYTYKYLYIYKYNQKAECQLSATLGAPCRLIFDTIHNTLLSLVHFLSLSSSGVQTKMSNSNPGFLAAAKAAQTLYAHVLTKNCFSLLHFLTWLQIFYDMGGVWVWDSWKMWTWPPSARRNYAVSWIHPQQ